MSGSDKGAAKPESQVIFLVGKSRGGQTGDRREVSPKRARDLVASGLARYPASKE